MLAIVLQPAAGIGQEQSSLKVHTDYPFLSKARTLHQLVYITSDVSFKGILQLRSVKYNSDNDSIVVLAIKDLKVQVQSGLAKFKIKYADDDTNATFSQPYLEILKRSGGIAPGLYKTTVTITDIATHKEYTTVFLQEADSLLGAGSGLRSDVNKKLTPASGPFASLKKKADKVKAYGSGKAISNAQKKLGEVSANRGLTHVQYEKGGKAYIDFYYENWFAGRYEVSDKKPLSDQLLGQQEIASATDMSKLVGNDLNAPSLFSQFKTFKKQKDDSKEIKGEIALSSNVANNPDPGSGVDNNYFEVRGMVEIPISGLPIELEGLYTSQDAGRPIKSSYFRVHYDVSKVKDELQQFIGAYNQKCAETRSKGVGMQQVYQKMISSMEGQKTRLINELKKEGNLEDRKSPTKIEISDIADTAALKQQAINAADSNNKAGKMAEGAAEKKAKALKKKEQLQKKYQELEVLDKKIEKYRALLEQNKNNNYFDSAVAYSKVRAQDYNSALSYKQLVKKSSDILPDGTAKKLVSGLTNVDAGMFSKYASKYTMSGQMMKGLDLGYDLGFCEVGGTVGKTEYVGRDGNLDKYTCYSGRAIFRFLEHQNIGLVYYGYTIDKAAFAGDGFFKNVNIATPTFSRPVHILSINYNGKASKYVTIEAEGAMSIRKIVPVEGRSNISNTTGDNMAWHISSDGNIPNTSVSVTGSYDKTGKQFENNTLPLSRAGTEQYKLAGKTDLFHSFVSIGVEYNYLIQSSFSGTASNTKWGFDIKTHSKRYPAVSISYKPFATFRSYSDTLNIPQRPLLGSVWTSKATYQLKENGRVWRFNLLYNQCSTVLDTTSYGNTLMQLMCMYAEKQVSIATIAGYTSQTGGNAANTIVTTPDRMSFLSFTESYSISKQCNITSSQDIGHARFGMCKYGLSAGVMCSFKKSPVTARVNIRYSDYKLNETEQWKQLYSGNMEVAYRFKAKKKHF